MDWPPHAYRPGQTARHPEDAFDGLKSVVQPLRDSPAWATGLRFLHAGYFWEAHELLEAVWMAAPERSGEKAAVQAVIQVANAALKARMGQPRAASRIAALARDLLAEADRLDGLAAMGLGTKDVDALRVFLQDESAQHGAI